ncbi:MAG: hypothetical protein QOI91_821 [Solirubrobacteraceae bacterium]|jgi:hypothetical protein|nr:hypothetical protein [Solirubrobacteraceae bacterium]
MPVEGHIFNVQFQIPGATEPDEYAIRTYEDDRLQDFALLGPNPRGVFDTDFERMAARYEDAVLSAIADLQRVLPEATMLRVKPDDLVTIDDIAERMGRTHESVRLLIKGKRGPGGFPAAAGGRGRRDRMWRWYEVERWFREEMGIEIPGHKHGAFLAAVNALLELRGLMPELHRDAPRLAHLLPTELTTALRREAVEDQVGAR